MYFFNQGEDVYHIIADVNAGKSLCGVKMSGLEQWRHDTGRATRRTSNGEPLSLRPCQKCEDLLPDSPPTNG